MNKKALVAMSGGVDSSVCAWLAMEKGYNCIGATMLLGCMDHTSTDVQDAASVCRSLGIEHHVFDMREEFASLVVEPFVEDYQRGLTPNPCVLCNRHLKLGLLYKKALDLGCDTIVTGHYARVKDGVIHKAKDITKDQSYVLCLVSREVTDSLYLPLGDYTKEEARAIARERGFVTVHKSDSQDICFVPDGDYAGFIEGLTGKSFDKGFFQDTKGNVLGEHNGIIRYTVGQRKGLGIAFGTPMYVKSKQADKNLVVLSSNEELFEKELTARDFNILVPFEERQIRAGAKIRYNQAEQDALVTLLEGGRARVVFDRPQRAIAPGQYVAVYRGDVLLGGGVIE